VSKTQARLEIEDLQQNLRDVQELLLRQKLAEDLVHRMEGGAAHGPAAERLTQQPHLAELRAKLDTLHPADVAYILDALPLDERLAVWDLVKADRDGEILLEVSDAVRESLIASMDSRELVAAAETLDADEIADIAADLPEGVIEEVVRALPMEERERLRAALSYEEGTVGCAQRCPTRRVPWAR
jgi:magnesium transporter